MAADDTPLPDFASAAWEKVEARVRAFESALARGETPDIGDYLAAPDSDRRELLVQLVHADLEFRIKAGQAGCVETYVRRFPELQQSPDTVVELIAVELRLRRDCEMFLVPQEYLDRFPEYKTQIENLLHGTTGQAFATQPDASPAEGDVQPVQTTPGKSLSATDRYEPIRFHTRGGLGEIHLARDKELQRDVALKRIQPRHAHDAEIRRRFLLEASVTARLQHPGVVPVYSLTKDARGEPCYAMRFIEGESLQEAIERFHQTRGLDQGRGERLLQLRQLLGRFVAVCNTVAFAHSKGVLHRDLKPGNIMLGKYGETLVVDWGLARDFDRAETQEASATETPEANAAAHAATRMGRAMGTVAFMSPEQAAGRWDVIGPASDIYSLGATLYTLLCGTPPSEPADEPERKDRAIRGERARARQRRRDVPRPLEAICLKAMAHRIEGRYASALELAHDVEHWLADEPVTARREKALERVWRWARRHGKLSAVAGFSFIVLAFAFVAVSRYRTAAEQLPLLRSFHEELDAGDWSPVHLQQMESLLANLAELSLSQAAEERGRLTQRLGEHIRKTLARPALQERDVLDLEAALHLLETRDPENAQQLRRVFVQRKGQVEPVLDLAPPYTPERLRAALGTLSEDLQPASEGTYFVCNGTSAPPRHFYVTGISCRGQIMISASFRQAALHNAKEIGVALNCKATAAGAPSAQDAGYLFLLAALPSSASGKTQGSAAVSLGEAIRKGQALFMRIERGGTVLRQGEIRVPNGPMILHAERAGDHLLFQINGLRPLESHDAFPLASPEPGYFAWVGSLGVGIETLQASGQLQASPQPTEVERGDALYGQQQFAAAQAHYLQETRQSEGTEVGQEALCKQGYCAMALKRTSQATKIFEELAAQGNGRWPLLATCQLWLHWIRLNRFDDAAALLERLVTHYSPEEAALYLDEGTRSGILDAYEPRLHAYDLYRPDRTRLLRLEQLVTVEDLFNAPPARRYRTKLHLVLTYELLGQLDRALLTGRELLRDPALPPAARRSALQQLTEALMEGDPAAALALIEEHLFESPGKYHAQRLHLLLDRASAHAVLDRWNLAAGDLQDYFRLVSFDKNFPHDYVRACLLKGLLLEHQGDPQGARAAWLEGYGKVKGTAAMATPDASILASLTDSFTEEDAAKTMETVTATLPVKVPIYSLAKSGLFPLRDVTLALRAMWNNPRGRDYARRFAFGRMPARESMRIQMALCVWSTMNVSAFGGHMSAEEDAMIWQMLLGLYDAWTAGKIAEADYFPMVVTWLGVTNQFGWHGAAAKFPRELRGPLAYCMARRHLVLGAKDKCQDFLQISLRDADNNPTLERLVRTQLAQFGPSK